MPKTSATFKYMPLERDAKGILRSALPVRLTHKTSVEFPALVDSCASGIFLPTSLANILGIENEGKPIQVRQVSGDNEGFEAIIRSVEILYNKEVFEVMRNQRIFVIESDIQFCLFGREPLFKRFDITFSEKRKKITLTRV